MRPIDPDAPTGPVRRSRDIGDLLAIMAALRTPGSGCAWDLAQSFATVARFTVEEGYEVADAIARDDLDDLCDELGDLLLQVVFHARMAEELGAFSFGDVVDAITAKMIRRHPHVFGDSQARDPAAATRVWETVKAEEKRSRAERRKAQGRPQASGLLDDVPVAMPALTRADKLSRRAASVGFVWSDARDVVAKIQEELAEVSEAAASGDQAAIEEEIGDLLFTAANLARHFDVDPEAALAGANRKFTRRFAAMETALAQAGQNAGDASLAELEALWQAAKAHEADRVSGVSP